MTARESRPEGERPSITPRQALALVLENEAGQIPVAKQIPHDHAEFVPGCFRCDLSREETR